MQHILVACCLATSEEPIKNAKTEKKACINCQETKRFLTKRSRAVPKARGRPNRSRTCIVCTSCGYIRHPFQSSRDTWDTPSIRKRIKQRYLKIESTNFFDKKLKITTTALFVHGPHHLFPTLLEYLHRLDSWGQILKNLR